jgi:MarR family transcriptional regulator, organic hydroperoxide resistance regulator
MKPEETVDFHLRWAWARISKLYNAEAAKHGGTMSIGYALLNIDKEGTPSTKLGPKMGMEPTSLTRLLKSMEEMELIVREPGGEDRRIVRVLLTKQGKIMREKSKETVFQFNRFLMERLPKRKLETFLEVINQINELLDEEDIFPSTK